MGIYVYQRRAYGMKGGCELPPVWVLRTELRSSVTAVCAPEPLSRLPFPCLLGSQLHVYSSRAPPKCSQFAFLDLVSHFVSHYRPHGTSVKNGAPSGQVWRYNLSAVECWSGAAPLWVLGPSRWTWKLALWLCYRLFGTLRQKRTTSCPFWMDMSQQKAYGPWSAGWLFLSTHPSRILNNGGGLCETDHKNNSCFEES